MTADNLLKYGGETIPYIDPEESYVDSLSQRLYAYEVMSLMGDCRTIKPFNEVFPEFASIEEARQYIKQNRK